MPTPVYLTGWEFGLFSVSGSGLINTANGTPTVVATGRAPGVYCAQVVHSAVATNFTPPYLPGAGTKTLLVFVIYIRKSADNSNIIAYALSMNVTAGNQPRFSFQTTGEVVVSIGNPIAGGSGTQTIVGPVVANDTWVRIDARVDVGNNPNTIDWMVNGVKQSQVSVAQTGTTFTGTPFTLGNSLTTQTMAYSWDDFVVSETSGDYPLGECVVLPILPGADGVHNAGSGVFIDSDAATSPNFDNTTTNAWTFVDDALPWTTTRSTTDCISAETHTAGAYMEIAPATAPQGMGKAMGVRALLAYSSSATQANLAATQAKNSAGTVVDIYGTINGTGADYSETSNFFKGAIVTPPAIGWNKDEIEAIRWRCGLPSGAGDVSPRPTWQMLMLEVAYPRPILPPLRTAFAYLQRNNRGF